MSVKGKLIYRPITDFVPSLEENERWHPDEATGFGFKVDTYGIPDMQNQIVEAGQITTPLVGVVAPKDKVKILVGNRRTVAGRALYELGRKGNLAAFCLDQFPNLYFERNHKGELTTERNDRDPEEDAKTVMQNLEKVPLELHEKLSPQEMEEILHDKGKEKRIRKSETIKAVFQLATRGFSEKQIARIMFHQIGDVTGNVSKIDYIMSITDARKRDAELTKWLHGTLGGFWLPVWGSGRRWRDCLLLTAMVEDGLVPKDTNGNPTVKPEINLTHTRWRALRKALADDISNDKVLVDGKRLPENAQTSPGMEALVEKYKAEDSGLKTPRNPDSRLKAEQLLGMADQESYDPTVQLAFKVAAGHADSQELIKVSETNLRTIGVMDTLKRAVDYIPENRKFSGKELNDLLRGILHDSPMEFQKVISGFLTPEGKASLSGKAEPAKKAEAVTA